jgi:hypothetical protein
VNAIWDNEHKRLISDAEIAEVDYLAFTSHRQADHIQARLIVRRVKHLNPTPIKPTTTKTTPKATAEAPCDATTKRKQSTAEQQELFSLYRHHAVFSDSPLTLIQAEKTHRAHAIIEQVHADLKNRPRAHLPSRSFQANSAWLVMAAIAFNLTRAAGCLASAFHAHTTTGTIRAQLINVPARLAHSARTLRLHLPTSWPWEPAWTPLFDATQGPPTTA